MIKQRRFLSQLHKMRLEPEELKAMLDEAEQNGVAAPFIVDLRHPLDYLPDPRVLPGAVRVGPAELALHSERIPRDRDVILYCTCPSEETSAKVALQLHRLGVPAYAPCAAASTAGRSPATPWSNISTTHRHPPQLQQSPSRQSHPGVIRRYLPAAPFSQLPPPAPRTLPSWYAEAACQDRLF